MKITYDVRDSDPEKAVGKGEFEKPKPGVYKAKIVDLTREFAKDGRSGKPDKERPMLVVKYEITDKRFTGSWMWDRVPLNSEAAKWKLDQFLLAFGVAQMKAKRKGAFDTDDLIGEPCRIRVKDGTYNNAYSPEVGAVLAPAEDGDEDDPEDDEVDPELGETADGDEDTEDAEDEDDDGEVLYYDMSELAGMDLPALKDVVKDLELDPPKIKLKSRVALSKWIFENQPGTPPDGDEEGEDGGEVDLEALGAAADEDDEEAIEKLTELAAEADLDPDDYDTWPLLAAALSEAVNGDEKEADESEEDGYDELDEKALKAELKDRNLSTKGTKPALIKRLRQDDATDPF